LFSPCFEWIAHAKILTYREKGWAAVRRRVQSRARSVARLSTGSAIRISANRSHQNHCALTRVLMPVKKHTISVEDLWSIKRIGSPTISPDGRNACAAVTRYDMDKNEGHTELWLFATEGGVARRLTAGDKDSEPVWSADGRWIAFAAKRKDAKVKAHVTDCAEYRFWDHWLADGRVPHVMIVDVRSGRIVDAMQGTGLALQPWEPSALLYDVSPDGREIAFTADLAPEPRLMNETDIVLLNVDTRRHRTLSAKSGLS